MQIPTDIVIFSDSKSALQALEDYLHSDTKEIVQLTETIDKIQSNYNIKINLHWIPGHTEIPGNERAGKLAKLGADTTVNVLHNG